MRREKSRIDALRQRKEGSRDKTQGASILVAVLDDSVAVGEGGRVPCHGLLPHGVDLLLAGLEEHADPVGVVVHGEVGEPGAGVGVDDDLVAALGVDDDRLAGHRVLVVVLVVLVEDRGHLLAVQPEEKQEGNPL